MAKQENTFQAGDKVRLANGKKPMTVIYSYYPYITAKYDHTGQQTREHYTRFVEYEEESSMTSSKDAIYKLNIDPEKTIFANYRGTDSAGNWLMERIGDGGGILVVPKENCEEVLPYTFSVRMNGREQHFQGEAGKIKKGDVLLYTAGGVDNFAFAVVRNLDTKSKGAKVWQGVKLITEEI